MTNDELLVNYKTFQDIILQIMSRNFKFNFINFSKQKILFGIREINYTDIIL